MGTQPFFLGRQPIIGRQGELVAYELLFRDSADNLAVVGNDVTASAHVIQHVFADLGVQAALGDKRGFINLSEDLLMNDMIEALPRAHVVLEILETVALTTEVVARCRALRRAGFTLALDDVTELTEAHRTVLPFVKYVKIDVLAMQPSRIAAAVEQLRPYQAELIAEKVDSQAQYNACAALGFDLFQGYFFARPVILSGRSLQPSTMVLLKLFTLTARDAELDELEAVLKEAPDLLLRLLKMANAAAFSPVNKVTGVRNAIMRLGRIQLNRLVQIMMFARGGNVGMAADPLLQTAVVRGRLMEGLAKAAGAAGLQDSAFMVGMLSLLDTLFGQELAEVVALLNLDDSVRDALLSRSGQLGMLLDTVEAVERADAKTSKTLLGRLGLDGFAQCNRLQMDALGWASQL
jgi:EAL and modified HD-GYP domain-containing signal transduction protein